MLREYLQENITRSVSIAAYLSFGRSSSAKEADPANSMVEIKLSYDKVLRKHYE